MKKKCGNYQSIWKKIPESVRARFYSIVFGTVLGAISTTFVAIALVYGVVKNYPETARSVSIQEGRIVTIENSLKNLELNFTDVKKQLGSIITILLQQNETSSPR